MHTVTNIQCEFMQFTFEIFPTSLNGLQNENLTTSISCLLFGTAFWTKNKILELKRLKWIFKKHLFKNLIRLINWGFRTGVELYTVQAMYNCLMAVKKQLQTALVLRALPHNTFRFVDFSSLVSRTAAILIL